MRFLKFEFDKTLG